MPLEVLVRFGRWDEILAEPDNYPEDMPFTRALHHVARAIALAAKGDAAGARKEQALFLERAKLVPKETPLGNNIAPAVALARRRTCWRARFWWRKASWTRAWRSCETAVKEEDALKYDEPPGWMIPVRHSLGAVLMKAGQVRRSRAGLSRRPDASAGQRLVALRPGREFAPAKEKRS